MSFTQLILRLVLLVSSIPSGSYTISDSFYAGFPEALFQVCVCDGVGFKDDCNK